MFVGGCRALVVTAVAERIVDKTIVVHARVCGLLSDVIFLLLLRVFVLFLFCFCFWFLLDLTHSRTPRFALVFS